MGESTLLVEQIGRVLTVTLHRPEKRNALDLALRGKLAAALGAVPDGIGAVVLTGTDPAFCAGVDVGELREIGREAARRDPPTDAIAACPVPVVAAVNGPCWTGGLELALACDFLIASERASFGDSHAQLGLMAGWGGSARLALAVGERRAAQLMLTG
ncbi:MAG: enoyl-CoA hydratase-related protein, partial [Microbacterium sp.]